MTHGRREKRQQQEKKSKSNVKTAAGALRGCSYSCCCIAFLVAGVSALSSRKQVITNDRGVPCAARVDASRVSVLLVLAGVCRVIHPAEPEPPWPLLAAAAAAAALARSRTIMHMHDLPPPRRHRGACSGRPLPRGFALMYM